VTRAMTVALCVLLLGPITAAPAWASGGAEAGAGGGGPELHSAALALNAAIKHAEYARAADSVTVAEHHLMHVIDCLADQSDPHYQKSPAPVGARHLLIDCSLLEVASATGNPPGPQTYPAAIPLLNTLAQPPAQFPIDAADAVTNATNALLVAFAAVNLQQPDLARLHALARTVLRYLLAARAALG
jgi:hypothetical protein